MEFVQRYFLQAKAFLGQVSAATRWLITCLLVILVLSGWLIMQYAGSPELVPISQFATDREPEIVTRLSTAGIEVRSESGRLWVPADQYDRALVVLASGDLMATDTTAAFDEMILRQSPWQSTAQNAQAFLLAKQKVLGQIVSKMAGVRRASVMLSMPERQGFGQTHVRPSASVNMVMEGRRPVDKSMVEAVAGLVSGAVAEMEPTDVVVIDANKGRQFTVKSPNDMLPGETFELVQQLEQRYRAKISDALSYIPGLIVAVNLQMDPVRSKQIEEFGYEQTEPLRSEFSRETERRDVSTQGEPGVRSNTGLNIAGGGSTGSTDTTAETRNDYADKNLTRRVHMTEVGHFADQVAVTVNVPRPYFVGVYLQANPEETESPGNEQLQAIIDEQLTKIQAQVEPLITTGQNRGEVRVHMIPDRQEVMALAGLGVIGSESSGGVVTLLESSWVKPVGLAALGAVSLGIMFGMVRKAARTPELPSIEELAGIPPVLPGEDDLIGEADESDASMDAQELGDDELAVRKIANEISDMIKGNPAESLSLLNRWVRHDD